MISILQTLTISFASGPALAYPNTAPVHTKPIIVPRECVGVRRAALSRTASVQVMVAVWENNDRDVSSIQTASPTVRNINILKYTIIREKYSACKREQNIRFVKIFKIY